MEIEDAHSRLTENFVVKTENEKSRSRPSLEDLIIFGTVPSKREPNEEFDELGEVPFNMLMDDTSDEPGKTVAKAAAIALGADDSAHIFSNQDFSTANNIEYVENFNDHSGDSFDGEEFMKNILNKPSKNECRRSSRNINKNRIDHTELIDDEPKTSIKRKNIGKSKTIEEQEAYKAKMKNVDNEIAQYLSLHCEICSRAQDNFATLRVHMRNEHNIQNGYAKCCGKKFLKRALLLDHIRQHLDPDCYK